MNEIMTKGDKWFPVCVADDSMVASERQNSRVIIVRMFTVSDYAFDLRMTNEVAKALRDHLIEVYGAE